MKRTHGETTGHYTGRVVDFALRYWFRIIMASCALSVAYVAHTFVNRFLDFTAYVFDTVESHKAIQMPGPSEPGTVD